VCEIGDELEKRKKEPKLLKEVSEKVSGEFPAVVWAPHHQQQTSLERLTRDL
jgi:hypothetical protein